MKREVIIDRLGRVQQGHADEPLFNKLDRREIDDLVEAVAAICAASPRRIRLSEVLGIVPLSASTIYARMKAGTFPRSQDLGGGVVCWREQEILDWLDALPESEIGAAA